VTISRILQTVIVLLLTAVTSAANADAGVGSHNYSANEVWSDDIRSLYIAGSGDNPWALPQTQKQIPQGPAYQVNPHYVTPEDIQSDSLADTERRSRKRGSMPRGTPDNLYRGRQQDIPYGLSNVPGYTMPGYGGYNGGYYGGFPWADIGAPGFGGNPLLYPYDGAMDLGDPYNMLMPSYPPGSEGAGNSNGM
jgi:hypothetical protein